MPYISKWLKSYIEIYIEEYTFFYKIETYFYTGDPEKTI